MTLCIMELLIYIYIYIYIYLLRVLSLKEFVGKDDLFGLNILMKMNEL